MQLEAAGIQMKVGSGSALSTKITAMNETAELFKNLYRAETEYFFQYIFPPSTLKFRINFTMTSGVEIGEAVAHKRIHLEEAVIYRFAENRFERCRLLRCERIRFRDRKRGIADEIVHAQALT